MWRERLEEISSWPRLARALWFLTVGLLFALFAFQHLPSASMGELALDDAGTWGVATRPLWTVFTLPTEFHSQPPLYYLVLHFLCKISDAPWFLRGFSFACTLAAVAYVLFRAQHVSLLARVAFSLLFMSGELGDYMASAVRVYGMASLLATVSFVLFIRVLSDPDRRLVRLYALATLAALYTNAFVVPMLPIQLLWLGGACLLATRREGWRRGFESFRGRLLAAAIIVAGYLPYLGFALYYQLRKYADSAAPSRYHGPLRLEVYWTTFRDFFLFPETLLWVVLGLMAMGLVVRAARRKWDGFLWLTLAVVQVAFVWTFINGRSLLWYQTKYMLTAYIAVCFLSALAVAHLPRLVSRGIWLLLPFALGTLAYDRYGKCAEFFAHERPLGYFQSFHKALLEAPGKKVVFFDIGYDGQHLEYQVRNNPEITVATMRGRGWASGGDARLDPGYVERVIAGNAAHTRCFYYVVAVPNGPYDRTFAPQMRKLGYAQTRTLWVAGRSTPEYCRP
jgi:hypothetical protein